MADFSVYTLGCKVNQYETEAVSELMTSKGYKKVDFEDKADICIINTCSVTAAADAKNRNIIRTAIKNNPGAIIVVTGCFGQSSGEKIIQMDGVSIVTGNVVRRDIPLLIDEFKETGKKILKVSKIDFKEKEYEPLEISKVSEHTRAFVKIQDGCTSFCTYCIIPFTRGGQRSRKIDDLKKEISLLAANGYKEIVLTGINLTSYGRDFEDGTNLVTAINAVSEIEGIKRIRLGSLEPMFFTEKIVEELSRCSKFCHQFHLALQSGSSSVLYRMNRHYNAKEFENTVNMIKRFMPDSSFTTDIMVGFPGETENEHVESMKFAEKIGFAKMHVFPYSGRPGTAAYNLKNQVNNATKKLRAEQMGELAIKLRENFTASLIGTVQNVLLEEEWKGMGLKGFSENYCEIVALGSKTCQKGEIVKVLVTDSEGEICFGKITEY